MTRQILAIQRDVYSYIKDQIPKAIKSESLDLQHQIVDIELSEAVIMKVYDNDLILDYGAKRVTLEAIDFREILIR